MSLIQFENVVLGYEGKAVIAGLSFEVCQGDYLCVLGQNGSGKSTMMKSLLGLLQPISGQIHKNVRKNGIGYLPQQQPTQADFPASVREVVLSGCQGKHPYMPFYTKEDKHLAKEKMELMNITHLEGKSFRELSGGQKQRVLLARTLCAADELILLDEPTAGLDPVVTEDLYELINRINKERGVTVIMISHDPAAAKRYASHILHLGQQMLYFGKTEDYDRAAVIGRELNG